MGGAGVMRSAAKVAGFGVFNSGLRGVPSVPAGENTFYAAAKSSSSPASAILSSSSAQPEPTAPVLNRPVWEVDDWEFAGDGEGLVSDADYPLPRLVFGGAPTLDEAKSATADLKGAVEIVNFHAPNYSGAALPPPSNLSDFKACITIFSEDPAAPLPNHAVQAFKLLTENSAAQTVVASIASDPNVWNAVMQNDALTEFLQSHKINNEDICDANKSGVTGTGFADFMVNVKNFFLDMVNKVSDFVRDSVGGLTGEYKPGDPKLNGRESFMQSSVGASLMALAVAVIMMVVLKRP